MEKSVAEYFLYLLSHQNLPKDYDCSQMEKWYNEMCSVVTNVNRPFCRRELAEYYYYALQILELEHLQEIIPIFQVIQKSRARV